MIANAVQKIWAGENIDAPIYKDMIYQTIGMEDQTRRVNVGCLEQSNGFSILGGPPTSPTAMGEGGHVRDKDGIFASILLAEVAAYAKSLGTTLFDLLDEHIYLDPDIGYFVTYYESVPQWGEFKGLEGITTKIELLRRSVKLSERVQAGEPLFLGGLRVLDSEIFTVGKYADAHQWPEFPDEGIRFYFDQERWSYLTIRPSGTSQCLRYHIQLKAKDLSRENIIQKKLDTNRVAKGIISNIRKKVEI